MISRRLFTAYAAALIGVFVQYTIRVFENKIKNAPDFLGNTDPFIRFLINGKYLTITIIIYAAISLVFIALEKRYGHDMAHKSKFRYNVLWFFIWSLLFLPAAASIYVYLKM